MERPRERALSLSLYWRISPRLPIKKRFQPFADVREKLCTFPSVIYSPWVLVGRESHLSIELHNEEPKSFKLPPRRQSMAVFLQWSSIFSGKLRKWTKKWLLSYLPCLDTRAKQTPLDFQESKYHRCSLLFLPLQYSSFWFSRYFQSDLHV